jgi:hypothetical protein
MTVARWTLIAGLMAGPALAEGRVALIVASTAAGVPEKAVRGDALDLSESLFGMGFTVTRLENPTAAQVDAAIAGMPKTGTALFYFAGPAVVEEGENILLSGTDRVPLDAAVQRMTMTGRAQTLVMLDTCHGAGAGLAMPDDGANLFMTLPNAPGVDCVADAPSLAMQLLEKVEAPGVPLAELFPATEMPAAIDGQPAILGPGLWVRSSLTVPFILREATPATQLSAADYRMLENLPEDERANLLALWQAAGIAVDIDRPAGGTVSVVQDQTVVSPVQPIVETASIIAPVAAVISPIVAGSEVQGEDLAILTAAPARSNAARPVPGAGGLPKPSVILGDAPTLVALETPTPETPPTQLLDYTDLTARAAVKTADPAEYDRLILAGSYDPPPDQLPVAVQTELKRMGCYRGGIDGQWGPGSRRALQLYFDTRQAATATQEPTIEVFHALLQKDDVECPAPAVVEAAPAATTRNTTRTTTQAAPVTRRQPAAAAPAPAAPAPATTGRRIRQNTGTGAFR